MKLQAFWLADALARDVYKATLSFPREELFGLSSQMRRSAVSTACNIVEGSARRTESDYLHFLDMAYGSACELQYLASLASDLGYLDDADCRRIAEMSAETTKVLNCLIRSFRSGK